MGSSATIGTTSVFAGSVLALTDISLQTGATVQGRMLARNGQISLDTNTITRPACAAGPTATPTATPTAAATPSATPSTGGPGAGGPGGPDTPIPTGHPGTGRLPDLGGGTGWLMLGLLCLGGAGAAAVRGSRRPRATDQPGS